MIQPYVHRITSKSLQKRTGVVSLKHELGSHTLLWAGHAARMPKDRLPKRLVLPWVRKARPAFGEDMNNGRSLERHLGHFDPPLAYNEWAHLVQSRTGWRTRVTAKPFDIGASHVRQPRGDTRVTPEAIWRLKAQRAAEAELRRAALNPAADNDIGDTGGTPH